jgi:hypothetical protein
MADLLRRFCLFDGTEWHCLSGGGGTPSNQDEVDVSATIQSSPVYCQKDSGGSITSNQYQYVQSISVFNYTQDETFGTYSMLAALGGNAAITAADYEKLSIADLTTRLNNLHTYVLGLIASAGAVVRNDFIASGINKGYEKNVSRCPYTPPSQTYTVGVITAAWNSNTIWGKASSNSPTNVESTAVLCDVSGAAVHDVSLLASTSNRYLKLGNGYEHLAFTIKSTGTTYNTLTGPDTLIAKVDWTSSGANVYASGFGTVRCDVIEGGTGIGGGGTTIISDMAVTLKSIQTGNPATSGKGFEIHVPLEDIFLSVPRNLGDITLDFSRNDANNGTWIDTYWTSQG